MSNNEIDWDFANGQVLLTANGTTKVISADSLFGSAAWKDVGNSGNTIPLLDGMNTWTQSQIFDATKFLVPPKVGADYIITSGSNSDGQWVRYFDGTQIVFGDTGTIASSSYVTVTWAQPFTEVPSVALASVTRSGYVVGFGSSGIDSRSTVNAKVYSEYGATNAASYIAIGRWK